MFVVYQPLCKEQHDSSIQANNGLQSLSAAFWSRLSVHLSHIKDNWRPIIQCCASWCNSPTIQLVDVRSPFDCCFDAFATSDVRRCNCCDVWSEMFDAVIGPECDALIVTRRRLWCDNCDVGCSVTARGTVTRCELWSVDEIIALCRLVIVSDYILSSYDRLQ